MCFAQSSPTENSILYFSGNISCKFTRISCCHIHLYACTHSQQIEWTISVMSHVICETVFVSRQLIHRTARIYSSNEFAFARKIYTANRRNYLHQIRFFHHPQPVKLTVARWFTKCIFDFNFSISDNITVTNNGIVIDTATAVIHNNANISTTGANSGNHTFGLHAKTHSKFILACHWGCCAWNTIADASTETHWCAIWTFSR